MKVVSNTSPLIAFAKIELFSILKHLFHRLAIPHIVCTEFFQNCTQAEATQFMNARQQFIDVIAVEHFMSFPRRLDQGEHAVLSLALHQSADILLVDDRKAFHVAQEYGMTVISTRTVLRMAEEKQLIPDFQEIEKALQAKQFFLPSY